MRQSYLKNAAVLTASDVVLRLAGMGFRIYLANALGGEGMGLYQLVLAVYSLFMTLATSGVSVAATRLLAEELEQSPAKAHGMLVRLAAAALGLGSVALAAQLGLAEVAARWWLGDVRAAAALRAASFSLPFMALSAVLRGFFVARRQVNANVFSQLVEQTFRIAGVCWLLERTAGLDVGARCAIVLACSAASEAVSSGIMLWFYRREARLCFGREPPRRPADPARRLWQILWPVEGGRFLSSALHTAENMLVPACLTAYLGGTDGRSRAVTQYGNLKGMAMPLLTFPFGLLGSLSVLLMPEVTQAHIAGQQRRLKQLLGRMLSLTMYFSLFVGAAFLVLGQPLARLLYKSEEAGFYLQVLGPAMPFLYLESMVDGAMKGIGEQKASFRYSVWDSVLRIAGVALLLPRFGMKGFLFVMLLSNVYTCMANTQRLLRAARLKPDSVHWFGGPLLASGLAVLAGQGTCRLLQSVPETPAGLLLKLAAGGAAMALAYLAAAWPLGLGRELQGLWRGKRAPKTAET